MIGERKVLAVITVRGRSKGLPAKNIRPLAGLPLIGWTIKAAEASRYVDLTILSSDDPEIIAIAVDLGCYVPFVRLIMALIAAKSSPSEAQCRISCGSLL